MRIYAHGYINNRTIEANTISNVRLKIRLYFRCSGNDMIGNAYSYKMLQFF